MQLVNQNGALPWSLKNPGGEYRQPYAEGIESQLKAKSVKVLSISASCICNAVSTMKEDDSG